MSSKRDIGLDAENMALDFLEKQGLNLLEANFLCRLGEIDLIMRDKKTIVFVEIRSKTPSRYGSGAESITYAKQKKLTRTAAFYLKQKKSFYQVYTRFDVISINLQTQAIQWIKQAFSAML